MSNNQGEKTSFYNFLEKNRIVIPKIQRDYVQGRESVRIARNRTNFIGSLIDCICYSTNMNLNFVYGYEDENKSFIPIDGQQRLTTLFLLHMYIFARAGEDLSFFEDKFTYETRNIAKRYFESLIINIPNICREPDNLPKADKKSLLAELKSVEHEKTDEKLLRKAQIKIALEKIEQRKISKRIENSNWFSYRWKSDTTVCSSLIILDAIEQKFKTKADETINFKNLADKLKNNCPITFMVLKIEELGKPEELYIKMNARGKQLTDFENFKADMYKELDTIPIEDGLKKTFKNSIDGCWLEYIWDLFDNNAFQQADPFYRNILHWVFTTRLAEIFNKGKKAEPEILEELFDSDTNFESTQDNYKKAHDDIENMFKESCVVENCCVGDYLKGKKEHFKKCIYDFYALFWFLCSVKENTEISKEINNNLFVTLHSNSKSMSYPERVLMFSVIKYSLKHFNNKESINVEDFENWWRLFKNLIINSNIDNENRFRDALSAIESFEDSEITSENILKIKFFDKTQVVEEYLKLKLIENNPEWRKIIFDIERDNKYFEGEIYFSFRLICDELLELDVKQDAIDESIEKINTNFLSLTIDAFKEIWCFIREFYNNDSTGLVDELENNNIYRRALLTYGDYSLEIGGGKYILFFEGGKNYYDWRRMLRENKSFQIFKSFLKDFVDQSRASGALKTNEFVKNCVDNYSSKAIEQDGLLTSEMVKYLVLYPELFDYMSQNRFAYDYKRKNVILYKGATLQAQYVEIKTYIIYLMLRGEKEEDSVKYVCGQGSLSGDRAKPHLKLTGEMVEAEGDIIKIGEKTYNTIEEVYKAITTE